MSKAKVFPRLPVILWKYSDGSGSGIVRIYENQDSAIADYDMLRSQNSDRIYELTDAEYIES